jgi:hypothetical protein
MHTVLSCARKSQEKKKTEEAGRIRRQGFHPRQGVREASLRR